MKHPQVVGSITDKYGDSHAIVRRRGRRLSIANTRSTVTLALNRSVAPLMGKKIKYLREARRMTLTELGERAGLVDANMKERVWAIENATRGEGIRLGTLYALAHALGVEAWELMPSNQEVLDVGHVRDWKQKRLTV